MIRRALNLTLLVSALSTITALATPIQLANIPISLEPNAKLLTLTDDGIRKAYPSPVSRPDVVFLTEDRKVTMSFEWRPAKLTVNEVPNLVTQFPAVIRSQVPELKSLKANLIQMNSSPWAQFVFTTPSQGDELRRELLVTSVGGRMLVLTIAGKTKDYSRNEAVVRNLAGSIRVN